MRITWLSILVLVAAAGAARAEHRGSGERPAPDGSVEALRRSATERTLSLSEINAKVKPLSAEIGKCYLDAAADVRGAGQLMVQLAIHRRGKLDAVTVQTPGLSAKLARKIEACVRTVVEPLEFPARRAPTTAVLPFYFQHTAAPGAGPQLSCHSPRGCPGR